ncbi:MAG: hypothetical protein ACTHKB_15700 [Burkholderiaceae bacterium]
MEELEKQVANLAAIRAKMAKLQEQEAITVAAILSVVKHDAGQKTYPVGDAKKIVVKTGFNYTLNKELLNQVWTDDLPINRGYAYTLRAKEFAVAMKDGEPEKRKLLQRAVTSTPAKPSVKIEA